MNKDEALKLALEALEDYKYAEARTIIREALAQPEHGWTPERIAGIARLKDAQDKRLAQPEQDWIERERAVGYREGHMAALSQRTWVEIDGDDWIKALEMADFDKVAAFEFFENKLKELNT